MAASFEFRVVTPGALTQYPRFVKSMQAGELQRALLAGTRAAALIFRDGVKSGYSSASFPIHPVTAAVYADPPKTKKRWSGKSMVRSGQLLRSVTLRKRKEKDGHTVLIDPGKTYTMGDASDMGKKVADIAAQLENPRPFSFVATAKMNHYFQKIGVPVLGKVGSTIVAKPRPRPVWGPAYKQHRSKANRAFQKVFLRRFAALARKHGAK